MPIDMHNYYLIKNLVLSIRFLYVNIGQHQYDHINKPIDMHNYHPIENLVLLVQFLDVNI